MKEEHLSRLSLALGADAKRLLKNAQTFKQMGQKGTEDEGKVIREFMMLNSQINEGDLVSDMMDAGWVKLGSYELTDVGIMLHNYANGI